MTKARLSNFDPETIQTASSVAFLSSYRSDLSATITFTQTSSTNVTLSSQLTTTGITLSGSATGIIIPSGTPSPTTNALYNNSGTLYFNGSSIGGVSLSSPLTGFTLGTDGTQLTATDTILQAFQKIQVQDNTLSTNIASLQPAALASAIGSWTTYTPTWTGSTTNPVLGNGSLAGFWRRVGDSIEIAIQLTMGSTTTYGSGSWQFSLPSGYTANLSEIPSNLVTLGSGLVAGATLSTVSVGLVGTNVLGTISTGGWTNATTPITWASTNNLYFRATVPISQFTANINLLTNFTEYAFNTSATTSNDSSSYGYGIAGFNIQSFAPAGISFITKQVKFLTAIQPTDLLILEINNGNGWNPCAYTANGTASNQYGAVVYVDGSNAYTATVAFYSQATAAVAWSAVTSYKWRVRKVSNGNFAQGSPSYSQTIGDGASTSIVVTHNLGTLDVQANVWELTGNLRQITSGIEIRNTSTTQTTLVFASAPALNSLRVTIFSSGGTQAMGDRLSPIANAERLITTTDTASVNTWNNCTATSANYTVTLPTAASAAGKILGIRIDPSSTYLVTIAGNGAELIDGINTRIMWAGEVCELKSNGTSWNKIAGKSIPMSAVLGFNGNQLFTTAGWVYLNYNTQVNLNAPAAFINVSAPGKLTALRSGQYRVDSQIIWGASNASATAIYGGIVKNGAGAGVPSLQVVAYQSAGNDMSTIISTTMTLATNDYLQATAYFNVGSFTTTSITNDGGTGVSDRFSLLEIPTW